MVEQKRAQKLVNLGELDFSGYIQRDGVQVYICPLWEWLIG
jgi:hypothetical protein